MFVVLYSFAQSSTTLWYDRPAENWESDALPIGNGRVGAMLFGGLKTDRIQFNEQSLWSGDNNWDGEYETGDHGFGSYRNFGDVYVKFADSAKAIGYRRELDLLNGVHSTTFQASDVKYSRKAFATNPDQVMVFHYSAGNRKSLSGTISMSSAQGARSLADQNTLSFSEEMPNRLKYAAKLVVIHDGGTIQGRGDSLILTGCRSFTIFLNARTNYKADYASGWRGDDPMPVLEKELSKAIEKGYKKLAVAHNRDFGRLMQAASIDVGNTDDSLRSLPTDLRLKKYAAGIADPDLEETMFQYGRYLLVSSSRPGGLPANLQGLWNHSNTPPWALC